LSYTHKMLGSASPAAGVRRDFEVVSPRGLSIPAPHLGGTSIALSLFFG